MCIGSVLRPYVKSSSTATHRHRETCGWFHDAGRSDGHEQCAFIEGAIYPIEVEWHFAEPADMRANVSTARTSWNLCWWLVQIPVRERWPVAGVTTAHEQMAVHVNDALRTGLL